MGKGKEKCYICKSARGHGVSLHAFPKDEYLYSLWIKKLKINDTSLLCKSTKICSKHFSTSEFASPISSNHKILYHNAVPSLNPTKCKLLMSVPSLDTVKRNSERNQRKQLREHKKFDTSQIECITCLEEDENLCYKYSHKETEKPIDLTVQDKNNDESIDQKETDINTPVVRKLINTEIDYSKDPLYEFRHISTRNIEDILLDTDVVNLCTNNAKNQTPKTTTICPTISSLAFESQLSSIGIQTNLEERRGRKPKSYDDMKKEFRKRLSLAKDEMKSKQIDDLLTSINNPKLKIIIKNELMNQDKAPHARRYSDDLLEISKTILLNSRTDYKYLSTICCLPSIKTMNSTGIVKFTGIDEFNDA